MKVYPVKLTPYVLADRYKPDDFYHYDPDAGDLWLNTGDLTEASKLAYSLFENGSTSDGARLICKMARGIQEFNRLKNEFVVKNLPADWMWGAPIIKKFFEEESK